MTAVPVDPTMKSDPKGTTTVRKRCTYLQYRPICAKLIKIGEGTTSSEMRAELEQLGSAEVQDRIRKARLTCDEIETLGLFMERSLPEPVTETPVGLNPVQAVFARRS